MSACGWLLTVQTPLKVSFWTGATSAWTFPLCTHSSISFAFRFRALPEPQSAVTVWLFSCRSCVLGRKSADKSQPNGEPSPKWRNFCGIPKRGSKGNCLCGRVHSALFVHSSQSIIWNSSGSEMWDFCEHPETQEHSACPSSRACRKCLPSDLGVF